MNKLHIILFLGILTVFTAVIGYNNVTVYSLENEYSLNSDAEYNGYIVSVDIDPYAVNLLSENEEPLTPIVEDKNLYLAKDTEEINRLCEMGKVNYIEPNYTVYLADVDISQDYNPTNFWNLSMIGADLSLKNGYLGNGVKVGVIDSGINKNHNDIKNSVSEGYNFLTNNTDTSDTLGHGSFVSGLIAAELNKYGMVGVAPKSEIIPLKTFSGTSTNISYIIKAIYSGVDKFNCDILNMSLGFSFESLALKNAVEYAHEKGVIMIAAVGNTKSTTSNPLNYPAAYDCVIGVGSVDSSKIIAVTSIKNESVFVAAPGANVTSINYASDIAYKTGSGTSYATPHVTAMAAILKSIDKSLSLEDIKDILINTSEDIYDEGYDIKSGYGIINVNRGIEYLLSKRPIFVNEIYSELNNDELKLNINLNNAYYNNVMLIFALKNSMGEIVDLESFNTGVSALENFECLFEIPEYSEIAEQQEYYVEAFVLDKETIEPLFEKKVLIIKK